MAILPWGSWEPDKSSYGASHTQLIKNVFPRGDGYGPVQNLSAFTDALGAACRGAFLALDDDGTIAIFAGTSTDLYKMSNTDLSWTEVSKSAAAYTLTASSQWQFAQSGTDVVAVATGNPPQRYTLGSSTDFADLGGSPPQASYATMINGFLVLSGLTSNPYRIAWSALNDITGWTAGTSGSDVQDFPDGGIVRGVAGGEFGWVFQDNCIRRMTFVAGDVGFEFDRLTEDRGLRAPYSLVRGGDRVYFLSADGFCELNAAGGIVPIGREKFDRFFFEEWDTGNTQLMVGCYDTRNNRVHWFYKSTTGASGLFDKGIVYDPVLQRAAPIEITGEYATTLASPGVTLDGLDTIGFTSIDALGTSFDDFPASTNIGLGVFNSAHRGSFLSGDNLEATLETSQMAEHNGAKRYFVRGVRPDTDAGTVYGSIFTRQKLTDVEAQSGEALMNSIGYVPHRVDGRVTKIRNRIPAATTWSYSIGVEPDMITTGKR